MIVIITEVRNKVAELYTALISRAPNLDNLNTTISSRADGATAVSRLDLTPARAAKLDNLDVAISAIPGAHKSVQTGYINRDVGTWSTGTGEDLAYFDTTISAVVVSKSVVQFQSGNWNGYPVGVTARLTSTTNIRCSVADTTGGLIRGRWTVIESN